MKKVACPARGLYFMGGVAFWLEMRKSLEDQDGRMRDPSDR